MKISIQSGELVPGEFEQGKGRKAVHCSLVSPLDQNPETKYKPYIHQKSHHDQVFAIDLESAQSSLDLFSQTTNGSVLWCDTVQAEFLFKIIRLRDGTGRLGKAQTERAENPTQVTAHHATRVRPHREPGK